ncbi:Glutaredoxin-like protein NrdH [Microbacterium oxydans]|uniref:Glutaredoxin-like protein NrdH n=1 Tax=Microbacterium oxydans TaxID=82380 RepID=A0A0F0KPR7_9MICO|nr:glutaredoxin domain-containing protein [Microbacterium oxydans]KJL22902.1 Glutaredoxin-like protein NrdH [Microbacterium oxydans]
MPTITVYSKPGCVQCTATERWLGSTPHEVADVTADSSAAAEVAALGYRSAPVVVVRKNGEVVEHWSGFNPDAIDRWSRALTGVLVPVAA